jgi:amidase
MNNRPRLCRPPLTTLHQLHGPSGDQPPERPPQTKLRSWVQRSVLCLLLSSVWPSIAEAKQIEVTFDLGTATLDEVQQAMNAGALTSVQLVTLYLRRIELYDQNGAPFLNSVLALTPDLLDQARKADELRAAGTVLGPLHGIPCLVKGSYSIKGMATSAGTTAWANLIAPEDCFLVAKLRESGAVIMGHANMDTWANSGQSSSSQIKGAVKNAYVPGTTAGGSSGGSGVAAAANFAFFTFGGETGASIRGPSDRNGVAGQRPTVGAIPSNHIVNLSPERDVVGPMARNVGDIAAIRDAVAFEDPADPWAPILPLFQDGRPFPKGFSKSLATASLAGKKLAVIGTYIGLIHPQTGPTPDPATTVSTTRPEIKANLDRSIAQMEAAGATVNIAFLPLEASTGFDRGPDAPQRVLSSNPTSGRFTSNAHKGMVEFLVRSPDDTPESLAAKVRATAALPTNNGGNRTINDTTISYMYTFGPDGKVTGTNSLSFASDEAEEHYTALRDIRRQLEKWMDENGFDALVFPVDSGKTPTVGSVNGRDPINAMHIPGTIVPNGSLPDGEPTCLIFVGRGYDDVEIFKLAYAFEQVSKERYSTPLAPALPEERFTYILKNPRPTPPPADPIITITSQPKLEGSGSSTKIVIGGKIIPSAELATASVFVNGKRVPSTLSTSSTGKDWTASFLVSSLGTLDKQSTTVAVAVEVTDVNGFTDVEMKKVKLPLGK